MSDGLARDAGRPVVVSLYATGPNTGDPGFMLAISRGSPPSSLRACSGVSQIRAVAVMYKRRVAGIFVWSCTA
ncbi:hypothetical protein ACIQCQ_38100, partial [Streptomyces sp. NPDC088394]|uniref:hypothetical protein n=1 Tax=Streptomyces sp. NPDC088394 TaxID=3365860 RepID=UPI0037FFCBF5